MNNNLVKDNSKTTFFESASPFKFFFVSLISAVFVIYPNIISFFWELHRIPPAGHVPYIFFFFFRFLFFLALIWLLLWYNIRKLRTQIIIKRVINTLVITTVAYLIYVAISLSSGTHIDCFTGTLLFQFFVVSVVCIFSGHISQLYSDQRRKEQEIEQLKIENLQSRYDALTNQINPHFFFNSLNGLTSLIRKKNDENTLAYVNKLSDVFRYILQSDKKVLVTLGEELEFVQSFRYMMEVRFANKLIFNINVDPEKKNLKIPVLSLLPLIENVVVHNTIDSEHKMEVSIFLNEDMELVVTSPVYPKLSRPDTNGIGLKNLESRFSLLMNRHIRTENDGKKFSVFLPLKK